MVFIEERTNVSSGADTLENKTQYSDSSRKLTNKEKRKAEILKKLKCTSCRIRRLAEPRYRNEKFTPKPYLPITLKDPEPLNSDLEEKLEELAKPKQRVIRENKFLYHQVFDSQKERIMRVPKSRNVISNYNGEKK
ncbi:hypothetical protein HHI36_007873 [Cryptolaemus montrouzieri]|uniref:Uncharacterized protein n=1 Tax=Cryptolaemus montrouzieri TaxID=559131 RepID=A0ABD2MQU3_9CUCU